MKHKITISSDPADPTWWTCVCSNTPIQDGFFPCDATGQQVEPTPQAWTTNCFVCERCGGIINQNTLEVVGWRA
jgi:hypothetical protein